MCSNYCTLSDVCGAFYVQGRDSVAYCKDPFVSVEICSTYLCIYMKILFPTPKYVKWFLQIYHPHIGSQNSIFMHLLQGSSCHKIPVSDKLKTTSTSIYLQPPNYFVKVAKLQISLMIITVPKSLSLLSNPNYQTVL